MNGTKRSKLNNANQNNIIFILSNILFAIIIVSTLVISILDITFEWITWDYIEIDVACQIVTTIVSFIISTIGISITLQKEECWGITIKQFNNLRTDLRYSIVSFIIIAIILSAINALFYVCKLIIATIGVSAVSILFCIYVTLCEIPLMLRNEKILITIIKNRVYKDWIISKDLSKDMKKVLRHLIVDEKNLKETYNLIKTNNDEFNKFLILKLLEIQANSAFELKEIESHQQQLKYARNLYLNLIDIINYKFDLTEIFGCKLIEYEYYFTQVLFKLKEIPEYEDKIPSLIADSMLGLSYSNLSEDKIKIRMSLILSMTTYSIAKSDFGFINALQEKFSILHYELGINNYESIIFALISMQLYFLYNDSQNASKELHDEISKYIDRSNIVNHIKIISWKKLFYIFINKFNIDFDKFMYYFILTEKSWDVPCYYEMQMVNLDRGYALRWYLIQLLISCQIYDFNLATLMIDDMCEYYIKEYGKSIFDNNKNFIVTNEIKCMLNFYGIGIESLQFFITLEKNNHKLFDFINKLHIDDLMKETQDKLYDNEIIANEYKKIIMDNVQNEWGYNPSIEIVSTDKSLSVLIEKSSLAVNYKEVMGNALVQSIFNELRMNTDIKIIDRDDNFDTIVKDVLTEDYMFFSNSMQRISYYLKNTYIRNIFEDMKNKSIKFDSKILYGNMLIKKDGFAFNFDLLECSMRDLSKAEISSEVDKYKRTDGQYVYEGTFLAREELEKYISTKFAILTIIIRYQIKTYEGAIVEIQFN